jgi:hypothetical protein
MPFLPWTPTLGSIAPPLSVAQGGTGATTAAGGLANLGGLVKQAATADAGYSLVNGTGNVATWTSPNDGHTHFLTVLGIMRCTVAETGGAITLAVTLPDLSTTTNNIWGAGQGVGVHYPDSFVTFAVAPNTAVTLAQTTALTAGTSIIWAAIWGI